MKLVQNVKLKDYVLYKAEKGNYIWKKNKGKHYIRLFLMSNGWHKDRVHYWKLELDFIPFKCVKKTFLSILFKDLDFKGKYEEFKNILKLIEKVKP